MEVVSKKSDLASTAVVSATDVSSPLRVGGVKSSKHIWKPKTNLVVFDGLDCNEKSK